MMANRSRNAPRALDSPWRDERRRAWLILLAAAGLFGVMAWPMLQGKVYFIDDLGIFHLAFRVFYARSLALGHDFHWCPHVYCGFDLHGEGQIGMYHPLHFGLYRFLSLETAFNLELLLCYPAILVGTTLFLLRWGVRRDAALFGGFLFAFAGFNVFHFMHINAIAVVAHLPWLLLGIDCIARGDARQAAWARFGVSALTASQVLLGYPQYVWICLLAEAFYTLFLWWGWRRGFGWVAKLVLAKALGVMVGAVQILPTSEALDLSQRAQRTPEFLGSFSLRPVNLLQWIAPYLSTGRVFAPPWELWGGLILPAPYHLGDAQVKELGVYNGAIIPALVVWLVLRKGGTGASRKLGIGLGMLAVLALVLAFGEFTPLFRLTHRLPGFNLFRVPARYLALVHFCTAVLAALAFADLASTRRKAIEHAWRRRYLAFAVLPILSLLLVVAAGPLVRRWPEAMYHLPLASVWARLACVALTTTAAVLVVLAARGSRRALIGILAFTAIDVGVYSLSFMRQGSRFDLESIRASHQAPPMPRHERTNIPPGGPGMDNLWMFNGRGMVSGYVGLAPRRVLDYDKPSSLRLANAAWNVGVDAPTPLPDPLPRARLVTAIQPTHDPNADIDQIDLAAVALVTPPEPPPLPPGLPGTALLTKDDPGAIRVATEASTRQLLVLSERYHPGWEVHVDGNPRRVVQVNGDFMGCVVGPGRHMVQFHFRPRSVIVGTRLSMAGCGLVLVVLIVSLRRARVSMSHSVAASLAALDHRWKRDTPRVPAPHQRASIEATENLSEH